MTSAVNGVELNEVLFDLRPYPLSQDEWEAFLTQEKAEENLGFWLDAQKYRQLVKKEKAIVKGRPVELRIGEEIPLAASPVEYAKAIAEKWIGPTAKVAEVNISDDMRQEMTTRLNSGGEDPIDFEPYQNEVKLMMMSGERFARFVRKQMTQNISESESRCRCIFGLVTTLIFVGVGVILRVLAADGLPRYGLALVLVGPFNLSLYFLMSGQTKT